jgi:hypothetical protein
LATNQSLRLILIVGQFCDRVITIAAYGLQWVVSS